MGNRTQKKLVKYSGDSSDAIVCFITGKDPTDLFVQTKVIKSFFIGLCQLEGKNLTEKAVEELAGKEFCHTSIFLMETNLDSIPAEEGILIEYGDYKENEKHKEVKYIYNNEEKCGNGLRYYLMTTNDFEKKLANTAKIEFEVPLDAMCTVKVFIEKISKIKQWTQINYHYKNNNCQTFVAEVIKYFKPSYKIRQIYVKDTTHVKKGETRDTIVPSIVLNELKKLQN